MTLIVVFHIFQEFHLGTVLTKISNRTIITRMHVSTSIDVTVNVRMQWIAILMNPHSVHEGT